MCLLMLQIMEESHTVRDGRTGEEKMKLTRGLGERQRTLEQQRRHGEDIHRTEHLQVMLFFCSW
jgi:hypothetical protein